MGDQFVTTGTVSNLRLSDFELQSRYNIHF